MDIRGLNLDWNLSYSPKRVISIVGPSRSGSTIFKHALCLHPELCSLAGEQEPYYKLANNGYPWHLSDEFHVPNEPDLIRVLIANELHNYASVSNRLWLQRERIEEPPFVDPAICRVTDTLVLKTPQDCYRRGVIAALYPDAEILYIIMKRDGRATVNGLLDGWACGSFTSRVTPRGWWCFDMPPNWSWDTQLLDRCVNQYQQATKFAAEHAGTTVSFELFEEDWRDVVTYVWQKLGLSQFPIASTNLPTLMATDAPGKERWRKKRPWLDEVAI